MDKRGTFVIYGIIFWIFGAVFIHYLGPAIFSNPVLHILFFVANFAIGAIAVGLFARMTGRKRHQMLVPVTIIAMPAMLMDGLAVTLDTKGITNIYSNTPVFAAYAGGALLFAFWSAFFFALLWHREKA